MTRLFKTLLPAVSRAALTMVATALVATGAMAQQAVVDLQSAINPSAAGSEYLAEEPTIDATVANAYGPELPHGPRPVVDGQPVNWISGPYLRGGVALGFDGSLLGNQDPGYTISAGFRQPLSPSLDERLFFDLGGSYLGVFGETTRNTSGFETTTVANIVVSQTILPNAFRSTLDEIQRGTAHASLGWYWGDALDYRSNDPQMRLATRIGGRFGHYHGEFVDSRIILPAANQTIVPSYSRTDTTGGLFVATEMILLNRDFAGGSVQFSLDSEYANDWISFGGWSSGSLGSGSILAGFMYSR